MKLIGGNQRKGAAKDALATTKARSTTPFEDIGPVAPHTQHTLASAIQGCWDADKTAAYVWLMKASASTDFDALSTDTTSNTGSNWTKPSPNRTKAELEPDDGHKNRAPAKTTGKESEFHTEKMWSCTSRWVRHFQRKEACCSCADDTCRSSALVPAIDMARAKKARCNVKSEVFS